MPFVLLNQPSQILIKKDESVLFLELTLSFLLGSVKSWLSNTMALNPWRSCKMLVWLDDPTHSVCEFSGKLQRDSERQNMPEAICREATADIIWNDGAFWLLMSNSHISACHLFCFFVSYLTLFILSTLMDQKMSITLLLELKRRAKCGPSPIKLDLERTHRCDTGICTMCEM